MGLVVILAGSVLAWFGEPDGGTVNIVMVMDPNNYGKDQDGDSVGYPVHFVVWLDSTNSIYAPLDKYWLEYIVGTNSGAATHSGWTLIGATQTVNDVMVDAPRIYRHSTWNPPTKGTNYLVRIVALLTNGVYNADLDDTDIDQDGGGTWEDHEVRLIFVQDNQAP
jgi:hypothetical protein